MFPKPPSSGTIYNDMSIRFELPLELRGAVDLAVADWQANSKVERFWRKDPTLWTNDGEEKWLGWIDIVEREQADLAAFAALAEDVKTTVDHAARSAFNGGQAVAVLLRQKLIGIKSFGKK